MAFKDLQQFGFQYQLLFDKTGVVFGNYKGYPLCVEEHTNERYYNLFSWIKPSENTPDLQQLPAVLSSFAQGEGKPFVRFCTVEGYRVTIQIKMTRHNLENLSRTAEFLLSTLAGQFYEGCCASCARTDGLGFYRINGTSACLCEPCYQTAVANLSQNEQAVKKKKGNLVTGIVGALLGALLGGVLWVLVSQLGYIAGIVGLVVAVCAVKGFELFGGKLNAAGIIICMVIVVGAIYAANYISYSIYLQQALDELGYGFSFGDSMRLLPDFFSEEEIFGAFLRDLVIGYLLTAVASFSVIYGIYRKSNQKFTSKRLGE